MKKATEIVEKYSRLKASLTLNECDASTSSPPSKDRKFHALVCEDGVFASGLKFDKQVFYYIVTPQDIADNSTKCAAAEIEACWYQFYFDSIRINVSPTRCHPEDFNPKLRERAADILVSPAKHLHDSHFLHIDCKNSSAMKKTGRLSKKNPLRYEKAVQEVESFVRDNIETYANWLSLAASLSLNDSGIIAGSKKKKHLSR